MPRIVTLLLCCAGLAIGASTSVPAQPPADLRADDLQFYQQKVQPILAAQCFPCHSHKEKKSKGGLMLDSRPAVVQGGDDGIVVVPGQPEQSLLIRAVTHADDAPHMPPKGKLSQDQVAVLKEWIKRGVPGPASISGMKVRSPGKITQLDKTYWAFAPIKPVNPPSASDQEWNKNPIDQFIKVRLEKEGLASAPIAKPEALLRRLYFDLLGLPPEPEQVAAFTAQPTEAAYAQIVDRLFASPGYSERSARVWLDLVRYAESDGYKADDYRPTAWRYRDYVISSFNRDKPFDQFVMEQLAGDELAPDDPDALAATGFLSLGIYEYNNRDVRGQWQAMLDELTDVTGDVFLGLGMSCARCHDHKFDPILQKDYYRLQAFYAAWQPREDVPLLTPAQKQAYDRKQAVWLKKTESIRARLAELEAPEKTKAEQDAIAKFNDDLQGLLKKRHELRDPLEKQIANLAYRQIDYEFERVDKQLKGEKKEQYAKLIQELAQYDADKPILPLARTASDIGPQAPPIFIPKKQKQRPVAPGFPTVLEDRDPVFAAPARPDTTGRRLTLARWIADAKNPLTARVLVNRIWQQHFGRGLVVNTSDFGTLSDPPSHPELLDYLSARFVQEGWSLKKLHKLIVTSRTYGQSSAPPDNALALRKDPENKLLWRMNPRRLEAEQIRDAILAATGKLDLQTGGPSVRSTQPRRSIYTRMLRNTRDPLLEAFDAPDGILSSPQRYVSTTPMQALLMMNSPVVWQHAQALASRLERDRPGTPSGQIDLLYRLLLGRAPTGGEQQAALSFLENQAKLPSPKKPANSDDKKKQLEPAAKAPDRALADLCHVFLNANEFLYID